MLSLYKDVVLTNLLNGCRFYINIRSEIWIDSTMTLFLNHLSPK